MSVKIAVTVGRVSVRRSRIVVERPIGTAWPSGRAAVPSARAPPASGAAPRHYRGPERRGAPLELIEDGPADMLRRIESEQVLGGHVDEREDAAAVHGHHTGADVPEDLVQIGR